MRHRNMRSCVSRFVVVALVAISFALLAAPAFASSHMGFLNFTLIAGSKSGYYTRNGYYGRLKVTDQYYNSSSGQYTYTYYYYPAVSGDNVPSHQNQSNVGPIPEGTYDFGFVSGSYVGYTSSSDAGYSPGGWKLDPFYHSPRGLFWVHGGSGSSAYPHQTAGCIRISAAHVTALKAIWTNWSNKTDKTSCEVYVNY